MIFTRMQACQILNLPINATDAQIKTAYKELVKLYHPDSGKTSNVDYYNAVVEAYEFLCAPQNKPYVINTNPTNPQETSLYQYAINKGNYAKRPSAPSRTVYQKSSASDYEAFEKKIKKQKQQKAAAFEKMTHEYSKQIEKQEADYKKAMDAINAIRTARAIEAMILAQSTKEPGPNEKPDSSK